VEVPGTGTRAYPHVDAATVNAYPAWAGSARNTGIVRWVLV
jgi:hypothetical protein